ncbi:MAG: nucleotidyltransferase domain-containing protein [Candidatus Bathyarchaeia archaeon]
MSRELLVKTALKRQKTFRNLSEHLKTIKNTVHKLDPEAETFMFGSVAEKKHNYSSDIDILIITKLHPARVHSELWKAGIREPFEIHVHSPEKAVFYKTRTKLVKV